MQSGPVFLDHPVYLHCSVSKMSFNYCFVVSAININLYEYQR